MRRLLSAVALLVGCANGISFLETGIRGQGGGRPLNLDFGLKSLEYNESYGGLIVDLWAVPEDLHSIELRFHDQDMRPLDTCPAVLLCTPPPPAPITRHLQQGPTEELVVGWPACGVESQRQHVLQSKEMTVTDTFKPLEVWHASAPTEGRLNVQVSLPRSSLADCGMELVENPDEPNEYAGTLCVTFKYAAKEGFKGNNYSSTTLESCHLLSLAVPPLPKRALRGAQ